MCKFTIRKEVLIIMNYNLNLKNKSKNNSVLKTIPKLLLLLKKEKKNLIVAFIFIILGSGLSLLTPILIGKAVDQYISKGLYGGLLIISGVLLIIYLVSLYIGYLQTLLMGKVGQRMLFTLRNLVFHKLQSLPVAFFNQNKAGDLISRINNDTEKLNIFFSQSLVQFVGSVFVMLGAGIFLIAINPKLGLLVLIPAVAILIITKIISPWVKQRNLQNLTNVGGMSGEIQESLDNFKVIAAFNRRDYFQERFTKVNDRNYQSAIKAGIANNIFNPIYSLAGNVGQLIVLIFGIYLIMAGNLTVGLLISFIAYANNFYNPLKQLAQMWASFQVAMAGWERISDILNLENNLEILNLEKTKVKDNSILEFKNVSFVYEDGKEVLKDISFNLEAGKTYALVGPTGGGKTTTASLMARLYDASSGTVCLLGQDIRCFENAERSKIVGFILQDPFLFNGTLKENILYGNDLYRYFDDGEFLEVIKAKSLNDIIERFPDGLATKIDKTNSVSLGQKQLIAFLRAILREPKILILDEATANIDTVTEKLLERAIDLLPKETTKVIIAHRLNTIENADYIYFVNNGEIVKAGNMEEALHLLMDNHRQS